MSAHGRIRLTVALCLLAYPAAAQATHQLPKEFREGSWASRTLSVGHPGDGHLIRGSRLRATAAMRLWNAQGVPAFATPHLLRALERAAARVRSGHQGAVVLVHALSSENGGPLSGKRSHQSGRDADLVLFARDAAGKPASARKLVRFGVDGRSTKGEGLVLDDARNWSLVEALVTDAAVTHVFVSPARRVGLLAYARTKKVAEERLGRVEAKLFADDGGEPLDALLHVRAECPKGQDAICKDGPR